MKKGFKLKGSLDEIIKQIKTMVGDDKTYGQ